MLEWEVNLASEDIVKGEKKLDFWKGDYNEVSKQQVQKND